MKILIAQDNMPFLSILLDDLREFCVPIEICINGQDVVDRIKSGSQYDMIFMNIEMPIMDGIKSTKIIRDFGYKKMIIGISFHMKILIWEKCLEVGMDDYIELGKFSRKISDPIINYMSKLIHK